MKTNYTDGFVTKTGTLEPLPDIKVPRFPHWPVLSVCVNSYAQFYSAFGGNVIPLTAVILENGVRIPVAGGIRSITYSAVGGPENNSLFRSKLLIVYDVHGYPESSFQDVWTLGCVFESSGFPPFTNILRRNNVYQINTSFWLNIPALGIAVSKIKYLVAE